VVEKFSKCCLSPLKEENFCPLCNNPCIDCIKVDIRNVNKGFYLVSGVEMGKDAERILFIMEMQLHKAYADNLHFDIYATEKGYECYF